MPSKDSLVNPPDESGKGDNGQNHIPIDKVGKPDPAPPPPPPTQPENPKPKGGEESGKQGQVLKLLSHTALTDEH